MSKKKNTEEKFRNRSFVLMLYPDNKIHAEAFEFIKANYDYAAILHDRDKWTAEDQKKDPSHVEGEFKKAHYHVVLRFNNGVWNTALAKELNLLDNDNLKFIQETKRFEKALQYLLHFNDPDKSQYEPEEVMGPLKNRLIESINKLSVTESEVINILLDYIEKHEGYLTVTDFSRFCAVNGYWSEYRRSASIFINVLKEKNTSYYKNNFQVDDEKV